VDCEISSIERNSGNAKILVIGDVMIDESHYCSLERKTPEGPFLVWDLLRVEKRLGGAGNLALNILAFGCNAILAGVVDGGDADALANEKGMKTFFERDGRPTTVKRRFFDDGTGAMLAREDIESREPVKKETAAFIVKRIKGDFDVVIFSDYKKGMFNQDSLAEFLKIKAKRKIADVKPVNARLFKGKVDILKMNFREFKELAKGFGESISNTDADIERAGKKAREELGADILITRSEKGMSYIGKSVYNSIVDAKEVIDIVGAGDTVTATFAVAVASGIDISNALHIANTAASIKITKHGAASVPLEDVREKLMLEERKILDEKGLSEAVSRLRSSGKKIVFTNGCFDIIHHGHVYFLKKAKELGDVLIVGLNSDSSIRKLKGEGRPKIPQHGRAEILSSFPFVDFVILFSTDTPEHLVDLIRPDVYAKGKDYNEADLPEARIVEGYGGKVKLIPLFEEGGKKVSSSKILS